jgi:parallel beta helix pectate lyase-like protein
MMFRSKAWLLPWMALACMASTGCRALDDLLGKKLNPAYCKAHPEDPDCRRAFPDASVVTCSSNATCTAPTGVCDVVGSMTCVECIAPDQTSACGGMTPICGPDHVCRACGAHAECPDSHVCLPNGSCATIDLVAYVAQDGTGTVCAQERPCGTLNDAILTDKPLVKFDTGTVNDSNVASIDGRSLTILADPGAKLTRSNGGVILDISNNADVRIYDLEITGGTGIAAITYSVPNGGIPRLALTRVTVDKNQGLGISSTVGGVLVISQSTIAGNGGGGVRVSDSQFDITNSFIVGNGSPASVFGGIRVDATAVMSTGVHRIDFNSIANNLGPSGVDLGIACGTVLTPLMFSNNIVYGNATSAGGRQISANVNCATSYSDIGPDPAAGNGNINADPMFVDPAQGKFHLMTSSPAKDAADPNASLGDDFDGDPRPLPQGGRCDMGADEIKQ